MPPPPTDPPVDERAPRAAASRRARHASVTPDYEVKLLLDPAAVLGPDQRLTGAVRTAFGMPSSATKLNVQFLDTDGREIYANGWSPRIRRIEGQSDFELTYKKRYPITAGDIDAALATARDDGFDARETGYQAQVEWGYAKQTLSIGRPKSASGSGFGGTDLPGTRASRSMLADAAPDRFDDWLAIGWGTDALRIARIYGPVLARRSIGTWAAMPLYIEIWPILDGAGAATEDVVEASFKTTSRATAGAEHDGLIAYLQSRGWLRAQDSLKTQLIMDRY
ncbi:MAG: hypothetical protein QOJ35_1083 [Solirubrobacteraceae bacterium]|nr:hypothetical protein [Solirubrobacteraceae bacterium]